MEVKFATMKLSERPMLPLLIERMCVFLSCGFMSSLLLKFLSFTTYDDGG